MDCFVDGPARHVAHKLRMARLEAQQFARRRRCMDCGKVRTCARLELLAYHERWLCLADCWAYHLGVLHGERMALRRARIAIDGLESSPPDEDLSGGLSKIGADALSRRAPAPCKPRFARRRWRPSPRPRRAWCYVSAPAARFTSPPLSSVDRSSGAGRPLPLAVTDAKLTATLGKAPRRDRLERDETLMAYLARRGAGRVEQPVDTTWQQLRVGLERFSGQPWSQSRAQRAVWSLERQGLLSRHERLKRNRGSSHLVLRLHAPQDAYELPKPQRRRRGHHVRPKLAGRGRQRGRRRVFFTRCEVNTPLRRAAFRSSRPLSKQLVDARAARSMDAAGAAEAPAPRSPRPPGQIPDGRNGGLAREGARGATAPPSESRVPVEAPSLIAEAAAAFERRFGSPARFDTKRWGSVLLSAARRCDLYAHQGAGERGAGRELLLRLIAEYEFDERWDAGRGTWVTDGTVPRSLAYFVQTLNAISKEWRHVVKCRDRRRSDCRCRQGGRPPRQHKRRGS